jgi:hypothetical protein
MHRSCHKATPLGCLGNRYTPNLPTAPRPVKSTLPRFSTLSAIRTLRTAPQPVEPKKPLFPNLSAIHPEGALLDRAGEASACRALTRHHRKVGPALASLSGRSSVRPLAHPSVLGTGAVYGARRSPCAPEERRLVRRTGHPRKRGAAHIAGVVDALRPRGAGLSRRSRR